MQVFVPPCENLTIFLKSKFLREIKFDTLKRKNLLDLSESISRTFWQNWKIFWDFHTVSAMHKIEYKYITNLFFKNYVYTNRVKSTWNRCCVNCFKVSKFNLNYLLLNVLTILLTTFLKALLNLCTLHAFS